MDGSGQAPHFKTMLEKMNKDFLENKECKGRIIPITTMMHAGGRGAITYREEQQNIDRVKLAAENYQFHVLSGTNGTPLLPNGGTNGKGVAATQFNTATFRGYWENRKATNAWLKTLMQDGAIPENDPSFNTDYLPSDYPGADTTNKEKPWDNLLLSILAAPFRLIAYILSSIIKFISSLLGINKKTRSEAIVPPGTGKPAEPIRHTGSTNLGGLANIVLAPLRFLRQGIAQDQRGLKSACAIVTIYVKKTDKYFTFAVQELARNNSFFYGQVKAPGGIIDHRDKTVKDAALRELAEESGLDIKKLPEGATLDGEITIQAEINGVWFVRVPLVVEDATEFIHSFRPAATNRCDSELCGGQYYLLNENNLVDDRLDVDQEDLISRVISELPIDKHHIVYHLQKMILNEAKRGIVEKAITEKKLDNLEGLIEKTDKEINAFLKHLNYLLYNESHKRPYMSRNKQQFQAAINAHKEERAERGVILKPAA